MSGFFYALKTDYEVIDLIELEKNNNKNKSGRWPHSDLSFT
jgi:hypothetical protein